MSLYSWTHVTDEKTEVHQEIKWITWELVKGKARLWTQKHFYSMAWVFLIVFYWHKINVLMTKYGVIKRMWPEVQLLSPDDLFSWLLINVAFPLMLFFPPSSTQTAEIPVFQRKKGIVRHFSIFPFLPQRMKCHPVSPEISVIQPNQVQMVFSSSDIILSKVCVVIYRNTFWTTNTRFPDNLFHALLPCLCYGLSVLMNL